MGFVANVNIELAEYERLKRIEKKHDNVIKSLNRSIESNQINFDSWEAVVDRDKISEIIKKWVLDNDLDGCSNDNTSIVFK